MGPMLEIGRGKETKVGVLQPKNHDPLVAGRIPDDFRVTIVARHIWDDRVICIFCPSLSLIETVSHALAKKLALRHEIVVGMSTGARVKTDDGI